MFIVVEKTGATEEKQGEHADSKQKGPDLSKDRTHNLLHVKSM